MRRQFVIQFEDATVWEQFNQWLSVSSGNDPKHHSSSLSSREAIFSQKKKLFLSAARKKKWKTNKKILRFLWFTFCFSHFSSNLVIIARNKKMLFLFIFWKIARSTKFLFKNRSRHRSAYRTIRKKISSCHFWRTIFLLIDFQMVLLCRLLLRHWQRTGERG